MLGHDLLSYWFALFVHSKRIGQRTDIYRNVEDAFCLKQALGTLTTRDVVLDIGSGSSPVPTFLYSAVGCKVIVTDLDVTAVQQQKVFIQSLAITAERFVVRAEDATKLSFADASVDFVSAVSMLEHIPGDGDIRAMREFCRVLKPGGRLVVTVPTSDHYAENASTFYYAGFERRYDPESLRNRLCSPGLNCIEQLHMCAPDSPTAMRLQAELRPIFGGAPPIDSWYKWGWHECFSDLSILLTFGFICLRSVQEPGSFGACLAFVKA